MEDYHILSMDHPEAPAVDHGIALHVNDVPGQINSSGRRRGGERRKFYLTFLPKTREGIFRIGVAVSLPVGTFSSAARSYQRKLFD